MSRTDWDVSLVKISYFDALLLADYHTTNYNLPTIIYRLPHYLLLHYLL